MMKYPYTLTAKIAMFPWKHHMSKSWIYKYYAIGVVASLPVFAWLNGKSTLKNFIYFYPHNFYSLLIYFSVNSPGNIKKYEDQMAKEAALLHEH